MVKETTDDSESNAPNLGVPADSSFPNRFFTTTVTHGQIQGNGGDGMQVVSAPFFLSQTTHTVTGCPGTQGVFVDCPDGDTPLNSDCCFVKDWAVITQENDIPLILQSQTEIFNNGSVGFQAGGAGQSDDVWVKVENTHLFGNALGVAADGSAGVNPDGSQISATEDPAHPKTAVTVFADNIEENTSAAPLTATGLYVNQAFIAFETTGAGINGNIIGNNGWEPGETMCTLNTEVASQTEFQGHVPLLTTGTSDSCTDAHSDTQPTECNNDRLRSATCDDTNANQISGYDRPGTENEDIKVGIIVANGAFVNAEFASFLTTSFQVDVDWTPITSDSFATNAGNGCAVATSKRCPVPPRAIFP